MRLIEPQELEGLAIFPLPNLVFFPHTVLPLHIFEPRYRKMIGDVLAQQKPLAVAQLAPALPPVSVGKPAVHPVAGVGRILESKRMPDGRYYLVLAGVGRIRILEELETSEPYRLVNAALVEDVLVECERTRAQNTRTTLQSLVFSLSRVNPRISTAIAEILTETREPAILADVIASMIIMDPLERQQLLELPSVCDRLDRVADAVVGLLSPETTPADQQQLLN